MASSKVSQLLGTLALVFTLALAACGDDTASSSAACSFDTDCSLGQVCGADNTCVTASCDFCTDEQICYKTPNNPEGSCSAPECAADTDCTEMGETCQNGVCSSDTGCTSNDECGDGEVCNLAGECVAGCSGDDECADGEICKDDGTCEAGCRDSMDCDDGEVCDENNQCAQPDTCTAGSCPDGQFCNDQMECEDVTDCSQVDCPDGEYCNDQTLECEAGCTPGSCPMDEVCNQSNGECEANNCPGEDPMQCMGNTERPLWDPVKCFCAECISDTDCDQNAGETCNAAGECFACDTPCDPSQSGTCGGATPYCINDCCVECVGAADCAADEICLDGTCGQPPNCTQDPSVCTGGTECNMTTGQCEAPSGGQSCDPNDPTSCPQGTFCVPDQTGSGATCQAAGGGLGCGFCNPDCTCDGSLTCDGFLCSGCTVPFADPDCPDGTICLAPLAPVCFPAQ